MIRYLAYTFFAVVFHFTASAQSDNDLIPYRDGDKWGYSDRTGKVVIQPQWDRANPFGNGKARVYLNDSNRRQIVSLIDNKGKYIIPPSLKWNGEYTEHSSGAVWNVRDTYGRVGHVDTNGNITIPIMYDEFHHIQLCTNYYRTSRDGKQGVITTDGKVILPNKYVEVWHSSPCNTNPPFFWVSEESTQADISLLDTNGKVLLSYRPAKHPTIQYLSHSDTVYFREDTTHYLWPDFPYGKREKLPFEIHAYNGYSDELPANIFPASVNGKWGLINIHGEIVLKPVYNELFADTGAILIGEKRLHTDNPEERYEFVYIDKKTFEPAGKPQRAPKSGIEAYKRKKQELEKLAQQFDIDIDRKLVDEILFQSDGSVAYRKGKHYIKVLLDDDGSRSIDEYTRHGAHLPVAVFDTANGEIIGFTLANERLEIARPPQPHFIHDVSIYTPQRYVVFEKDGQYALADTNFNILINFQPLRIDGRNYFVSNGKKYLLAANVTGNDFEADRTATYSLVGANGKPVPGFGNYSQLYFMNAENYHGRPIRRLMARNAAGQAAVVDLQGKVLYPDIAFKYPIIHQLGDDLFKVTDNGGTNIRLVNSKNKNLFPQLKILSINFQAPHYFYSKKNNDDPIPGIYLISLDYNDSYFYIDDRGKAFVKDFSFYKN